MLGSVSTDRSSWDRSVRRSAARMAPAMARFIGGESTDLAYPSVALARYPLLAGCGVG